MSSKSSAIEILMSNRYDVSSVNTVMLSHLHFDHIGDFSKFQPSTALYLGPFTDKPSTSDLAGSLQIDETELLNHDIEFMNEVPEERWLNLGCFEGVDYWDDGSFYVLSTPGVSFASSGITFI